MKNYFVITIICSSFFAFGQEGEKETSITKNTIYIELGGNGFFYSYNYDRIVFSKNAIHLGFRVGYSFLPNHDDGETILIPLEEFLLMGKKNNFFELGIGQTIIPTEHNHFNKPVIPIFRVGYRLQGLKRGAGFLFRIAALPTIIDEKLFLWGGISFGLAF